MMTSYFWESLLRFKAMVKKYVKINFRYKKRRKTLINGLTKENKGERVHLENICNFYPYVVEKRYTVIFYINRK